MGRNGGKHLTSFFASHQNRTEQTDATLRRVMDDEYARDDACSVILHGLGTASSVCVMAHHDDPRHVCEVLHQRNSATTTFSKVTFHSALERARYTRPALQDYLTRWVQMIAQLALMNAPIVELLLLIM